MSLWKQWKKGLLEYINNNKGNQYIDTITVDDYIIVIKKVAGVAQYDRVTDINTFVSIVSKGLDIRTTGVCMGLATLTGTPPTKGLRDKDFLIPNETGEYLKYLDSDNHPISVSELNVYIVYNEKLKCWDTIEGN